MCLMCASFKSFFYKLTHGFVFIFPLGIFVALALRFDVSRGKHSQYFRSAFLGYSVGLVLTIVVMNWFQAAQVTIACSLLYSSLYSTFRECSLALLLDSDGFFFTIPSSLLYCILYLVSLDFWRLIAYGMVKSNRFVHHPYIN